MAAHIVGRTPISYQSLAQLSVLAAAFLKDRKQFQITPTLELKGT